MLEAGTERKDLTYGDSGNPVMRRLRLAFLAMFTLSGATSLILQVVWLRAFSIVLGSTAYSMSCVLTAFMGGLAIGAALASFLIGDGRRLSRPRALRIYGLIELGIGMYGLAITYGLFIGQGWWLSLIGGLNNEATFITLTGHFTLSAGLLGLPTIGMGATLPLLAFCLNRPKETVTLYSLNTFGAASGSLLASFVFIALFGVAETVWFVAVINASICVLAFVSARALRSDMAESPTNPITTKASATPWPSWLMMALSAISGATFFSFELVWNRVLSMILGNRVYVTSITLAIVLVCLGLGARAVHFALARWSPSRLLAGCYMLAAVSLCVGLLLEHALWTGNGLLLVLFLFMFIPVPATALGVAFPLLMALPVSGKPHGAGVGRLFAVNTVGAMTGSLFTGYVLFETLGSNGIVLSGIAVIVASALVIAGRIDGNWRLSLPLTAAVAVIATLTFGIRGTAKLTTVPPQFTDVVAEDAYGVFSIAKTRNGYLSVRNNATELVYLYGHPETQFVQESQAHFPLLLAPRRDRVLVVGSGYGITAGAAASWPDVRHVDAVEILPLMVANAPFFEPGNHGYHHNPKVSVYVADGRHFLAAARQPYDVISINVSDPYLPGSSSLFSTEFYGWVTRALSQEGIVCQHLFGPDIASLYHGFKRHFSHVKVIRSYGNGVSVLGSQSPLQVRSIEALKNSALSAVLRAVQLDSLRAFEGRLAEGERLQKALEAAMPEFENSDLRPVLEFRRSPNVPLLYSNF